jgi:glycosyltransferase involved in cell wall biosynthesis
MSRFCFVTFEFHPATPGGCGVFVYNASIALLEGGHMVHILIDVDDEVMRTLTSHPLLLSYPDRFFLHQVSQTGQPRHSRNSFCTSFEWSAYRFNEAAKHLDAVFGFDLIEWFDYCGVAYYATRERTAGSAYSQTKLGVRLHNTLEVMDANDGALAGDSSRAVAYALEHAAVSGCDLLLSNGRAYFDKAFSRFYSATAEFIIHAPPPLFDFPTPPAAVTADGQRVAFLFYGRLYTWKGADLLSEAALFVFASRPDLAVEFHFVGYDSNLPPTGVGSYISYLKSKIPPCHRDRFFFHGQMQWEDVSRLLPSISCAVFPSYFESFCYAAHELGACGTPLLLSRIPAFEEHFIGQELVQFFDLSIESLAAAISRFAEKPLRKIAAAVTRGGVGHDLARTYERAVAQIPATMAPSGAPGTDVELVVVYLENEDSAIKELRASFLSTIGASLPSRVLVARQTAVVTPHSAWFLGRLCEFFSETGDHLEPRSIRLGTHLLVCRDSDDISDEFVRRCLSVFRTNPRVGFVGSWSEIHGGARQKTIDTFAFDALHAVAPWFDRDIVSRHMVRTTGGTLLLDLYDYRLGKLGEAGYLQSIEDDGYRGLTIPEVLVTVQQGCREQASSIEISHFLIRDTDPARTRIRTALLAAAWTQGHRSLTTDCRFSGNVLAMLVRLANWLAIIYDCFPLTRQLISRLHLALQRRTSR